jgi:rhamnosyl/mannosyltransferase
MKVLHFYKTAFPDSLGGIEQVMHQLASGGSALGVESKVLALSQQVGKTSISGYELHRAKKNFSIASMAFSFSAFSHFAKLARQADVVHYHFPWPFMDAVHFLMRIKKPTVVTYHSDIIRQKKLLKLYAPLMRKFLASVDRIVATSPNYLATSEVLNQFKEKVSVIPIGLDKNLYPQATPNGLSYWKNKIGAKFFLFVGVLRYYKGLHILLDAAKGLDYPIVIAGAGPIEAELKAQATRLGLKNIHFIGKVSDEDKVTLLTLCYGVVFPSHLRSEAFGISLLEGAMFGKPMISSEIGTGTTFINIKDETGLVIPPNDSNALRNAMQYLWENEDTAKLMGQRAEQRYWNYFTAQEMVSSYVKLYQSVIDNFRM